MKNDGIVRNRLKIASVAINAKAFLEVQDEFGSFDEFIWPFVNGEPLQNAWKSMPQVPARTLQSDALSKELKTPRLQVHRHHHLLRVHAGGGDGERPSGELLPARGSGEALIAVGCPARIGSNVQRRLRGIKTRCRPRIAACLALSLTDFEASAMNIVTGKPHVRRGISGEVTWIAVLFGGLSLVRGDVRVRFRPAVGGPLRVTIHRKGMSFFNRCRSPAW